MSKQIAKRVRRKYVLGVAVLGLAIGAYIVFTVWKSGHPDLNDTVEKIGRHMVLPSNETPVLAVVEDSSKLQRSL